jgi:hypothetical protein
MTTMMDSVSHDPKLYA